MSDNYDPTFDPSKEGRRVVTRFGQPNERQVTEDKQRYEEKDLRLNNATLAEKDKRN